MLTTNGIKDVLIAFKNISAYDAIECLCLIFKAASAQIHIDNLAYTITDLFDMPEVYTDLLACDFYIEFYGGPPKALKRYQGTLRTLVVDHFLYAYTKNKEKSIQEALKYVSISLTK